MGRSSEQIFDELLVIRCQEKDQEAVGLLWKRWQPKLLMWAFGFLKDQDQAYEIAQESWMSIFKSIHKLQDPAMFRIWAYRIVQRRSADTIKRLQRDRQAVEESRYEVEVGESGDDVREENIQRMLSSIQSLPVLHQEMLRLFYLEKYSVKMIARQLGLPEGTIKSRLFYARKELKEKLKETNHE
ncbi:RNA polymerase sigma factor [Roseivirga sp. E12]|uniref:RNA polymerase sigma factor n=1 Tax=Roseivirga sp. E12 TaxID=2819237 RepID=UPI001ABBEFE8|nr:RNA polymerase sigma factor [Roseivirga sp. E12]MBO3697896.1 RNA polymerase sigma factor [Roseivirga sp. E12]